MAIHKFDKEDKKEEIRNEIRRIAEELGRTPTQKDFKGSKTSVSLTQIIYLYGSWNNAVKDAGLNVNIPHPLDYWKIPKQELIDEFISVANKLGYIPSERIFSVNSKFSSKPYKTNFGSWKKAVEYITENFKNEFNFKITQDEKKNEENKAIRKSLKFPCPLQYIPKNESETIILFSLLASKLGYLIEAVRPEFPDAVLVKNGQKINCEFEYLSSNYIQHGHPQDGSCVCICWRKDIEIGGVEIFSLEEYLRENIWFQD